MHVYDTTLRDGAQQEGLSLSVADKLAIARHLDELGVDYIEGGWPGANPKDTEFFRRAQSELDLQHASLAAFGSTRRAGTTAATDPLVQALLDAQTPVVTLVAKSHGRHVEVALRTTLEENLAMVRDTVHHLRGHGRRVFLDAEHFFDGWRSDRGYALRVLETALEEGAEVLALCDTNGGMLPAEIEDTVGDVVRALGLAPDAVGHATGGTAGADGSPSGALIGIHCHNDTGCAVANSLAAVASGARHIQGTVNGYGERTGNADLLAVVSNLELKLHTPVLPPQRLAEATRIAHAISEVTNVVPYSRQPYVGASAFAHKAGLHASAVRIDPDLYQHIDPAAVGNDMRMLVSDMAGRASIELKGRALGYELGDPELVSTITGRVKALEAAGYTFEAADASFELLLREMVEGARPSFFTVESWRVITESHPPQPAPHASHAPTRDRPADTAESEATVKLHFGDARVVATGEGNGPVNALDAALRTAIGQVHPEIEKLELIDYKVRITDAAHGTDAVTRVLVETSDGVTSWETVGVGANILEASWEALVDGLVYGLLRQGVEPQ
ncbi:MAG: citramalate synthase [Actinomycetes bacterium]